MYDPQDEQGHYEEQQAQYYAEQEAQQAYNEARRNAYEEFQHELTARQEEIDNLQARIDGLSNDMKNYIFTFHERWD